MEQWNLRIKQNIKKFNVNKIEITDKKKQKKSGNVGSIIQFL